MPITMPRDVGPVHIPTARHAASDWQRGTAQTVVGVGGDHAAAAATTSDAPDTDDDSDVEPHQSSTAPPGQAWDDDDEGFGYTTVIMPRKRPRVRDTAVPKAPTPVGHPLPPRRARVTPAPQVIAHGQPQSRHPRAPSPARDVVALPTLPATAADAARLSPAQLRSFLFDDVVLALKHHIRVTAHLSNAAIAGVVAAAAAEEHGMASEHGLDRFLAVPTVVPVGGSKGGRAGGHSDGAYAVFESTFGLVELLLRYALFGRAGCSQLDDHDWWESVTVSVWQRAAGLWDGAASDAACPSWPPVLSFLRSHSHPLPRVMATFAAALLAFLHDWRDDATASNAAGAGGGEGASGAPLAAALAADPTLNPAVAAMCPLDRLRHVLGNELPYPHPGWGFYEDGKAEDVLSLNDYRRSLLNKAVHHMHAPATAFLLACGVADPLHVATFRPYFGDELAYEQHLTCLAVAQHMQYTFKSRGERQARDGAPAVVLEVVRDVVAWQRGEASDEASAEEAAVYAPAVYRRHAAETAVKRLTGEKEFKDPMYNPDERPAPTRRPKTGSAAPRRPTEGSKRRSTARPKVDAVPPASYKTMTADDVRGFWYGAEGDISNTGRARRASTAAATRATAGVQALRDRKRVKGRDDDDEEEEVEGDEDDVRDHIRERLHGDDESGAVHDSAQGSAKRARHHDSNAAAPVAHDELASAAGNATVAGGDCAISPSSRQENEAKEHGVDLAVATTSACASTDRQLQAASGSVLVAAASTDASGVPSTPGRSQGV